MAPMSLDSAKGTRKLLASFDSDESAYQSGNSSPAAGGEVVVIGAAATAIAVAARATPIAQSPKSALESLSPLALPTSISPADAGEATASLGSIELGVLDTARSGTTETISVAPKNADNAANCTQCRPQTSGGSSKCVHFSSSCPDTPPPPTKPSEEGTQDQSSKDDEGAIDQHAEGEIASDSASEAEFRDRLRRLFGLQPRGSLDASVISAASGDLDSSADLRYHQQALQQVQQRSRRPSLAARIFGRFPGFGEGNSTVASSADMGGASEAAAAGGPCQVCGENNCELHGSAADLNWFRRGLAHIGCYKTTEERERAQMLENNLVARATTIVVCLIIFGLIIALVILSVNTAASKASGSASVVTPTPASASATFNTPASGGNFTS